ncbi:hypothetical protein DPEC_G00228070 [Dallia pectoralis]|uniref:Uncharacterized protein n=1 Tax=Dallia pectoralis TaxID=75939 RepID=A0ACC2G1F9_DALPE|nr:hypothetical protein DPEC_G00228070 [Dallia pectoralis]
MIALFPFARPPRQKSSEAPVSLFARPQPFIAIGWVSETAVRISTRSPGGHGCTVALAGSPEHTHTQVHRRRRTADRFLFRSSEVLVSVL